MSSVHMQISRKVQETVDRIEQFKSMDKKREELIEKLISEYKRYNKVDLSELNQWTKEMNEFARKYNMPLRKHVTLEMFLNVIEEGI